MVILLVGLSGPEFRNVVKAEKPPVRGGKKRFLSTPLSDIDATSH
jgi:hypothetical protein